MRIRTRTRSRPQRSPWTPWTRALVLSCATAACQPSESVPRQPHGDTDSEDGGQASSGDPVEIEPGCGNGVIEADEQCDLGFANADTAACTPECTLPRCGDGYLAPEEHCDEGPDNGGDGCTTSCTRPTRLTWSTIIAGTGHSWDLATAMIPLAGGDVAVVREMREDQPVLVLDRCAADGSLRWSTVLPDDMLRFGLTATMVPTDDDGLLLSHSGRDPVVSDGDFVQLWRFDEDGDAQWTHTVLEDKDGRPATGRVAIAGTQIVFTVNFLLGTDQVDTHISRLTDEGQVTRTTRIDPNIGRVVGRPDGGLFATGSGLVMSFDASDELTWAIDLPQLYSGNVAVDSQGRALVVRRTISGIRELHAYSPVGDLVWSVPVTLDPGPIAVGPGDVVAVAGPVEAGPMELSLNTKIGVEVFDHDGQPQWTEAFDGPGNGADDAYGVTIADDDAVWVSGAVSIPFEERDVWIGRYRQEVR